MAAPARLKMTLFMKTRYRTNAGPGTPLILALWTPSKASRCRRRGGILERKISTSVCAPRRASFRTRNYRASSTSSKSGISGNLPISPYIAHRHRPRPSGPGQRTSQNAVGLVSAPGPVSKLLRLAHRTHERSFHGGRDSVNDGKTRPSAPG